MNKVLFWGACMLVASAYGDDIELGEVGADDFQELGEPSKIISGAYWGLETNAAFIKHNVDVENNNQRSSYSSSSTQMELGLLGGFGAAFHQKWYTGIELKIFRRFKGKTEDHDKVHIEHTQNTSLAMDVRLGRLFPQQGNLVYGSFGFTRVFGRVYFDGNNGAREYGSFGSFYPTIGIGIEHKIGNMCNVRCAAQYTITTKDNKHATRVGNTTWQREGKPNRFSIGVAVTRSI